MHGERAWLVLSRHQHHHILPPNLLLRTAFQHMHVSMDQAEYVLLWPLITAPSLHN